MVAWQSLQLSSLARASRSMQPMSGREDRQLGALSSRCFDESAAQDVVAIIKYDGLARGDCGYGLVEGQLDFVASQAHYFRACERRAVPHANADGIANRWCIGEPVDLARDNPASKQLFPRADDNRSR